jgi:hypothetical protein
VEQAIKREERGDFSKGIVLIETENAPLNSKPSIPVESQLSGFQIDSGGTKIMSSAEFRAKAEILDRRTDRRIAPGQIEIKASVSVPVTRNSIWTVQTAQERIENLNGKIISGGIKGQRIGGQWNYEVSVLIDDTQLELKLTNDKIKPTKIKNT